MRILKDTVIISFLSINGTFFNLCPLLFYRIKNVDKLYTIYWIFAAMNPIKIKMMETMNNID